MQQRSKNLKGIPDPIKVLLDQQISFHDLMKVDASTNDTLSIDDQIEGEERIIPMQVKHSDFAYVTLLHGIDQSFAYRGYLYNCIIMKEALRRLGSTADFIVMFGFINNDQLNKKNNVTEIIKEDLDLLRFYGIKLFHLPRLHDENSLRDFIAENNREKGGKSGKTLLETTLRKFTHQKVNFLEMALLKVTPWNFTDYRRVQYMDGDILPHTNMDCFFQLNRNSFSTGSASPVNSGWYLAVTNGSDYQRMKRLTASRFVGKKWDETLGWGTKLPKDMFYRGQDRPVKKWEFNGASLDQGLVTHYFVLHEGRIQLFDIKKTIVFDQNYKKTIIQGLNDRSVLPESCKGKTPMDMFYHFTGRSKPWLTNLKKPKDKSVKEWVAILDSLKLSVNSSTINGGLLKPPLGFFHPNK
jgi:hypothetical protein